jgi:cell wall-associated NlpC family hydrolase
MKFDPNPYVGLGYIDGSRDCFEILRDFFRETGIVDIPNYARAHQWWNHGENLYMDHYFENGFEIFHGPPIDWQFGDVFLMAIKSRVANHSAVHLGGGRILHHYYGRFSEVCDFAGIWRMSNVAVLRHKSMRDYQPEGSSVDLPLFHLRPSTDASSA